MIIIFLLPMQNSLLGYARRFPPESVSSVTKYDQLDKAKPDETDE
jgi:hypothetical protein